MVESPKEHHTVAVAPLFTRGVLLAPLEFIERSGAL